MVRARIRMFGPRLVVMLGRTHESRAPHTPRPALACPSHGCGWDLIESAVQELSRQVVRSMVSQVSPGSRPLS